MRILAMVLIWEEQCAALYLIEFHQFYIKTAESVGLMVYTQWLNYSQNIVVFWN